MLSALKENEPQSDPLSADDLNTLWDVVRALDGVGFYNCGPLSGARYLLVVDKTVSYRAAVSLINTCKLSRLRYHCSV